MIDLVLDVEPGHTVVDATRLFRALGPVNVWWLEDLSSGITLLTAMADLFRQVKRGTTTPIHAGEQIYLRQYFKELFEKEMVRVESPGPADVGGIAEIKWVAEYAYVYGIRMAPHEILDGLIGLVAHIQVDCAIPENFIGLEDTVARPDWWCDIVDGLPGPIVKNGHIEAWDKSGLGVGINVNGARQHLDEEDKDFFD